MTPLDLAGSMGVLLTVTSFLVGFDEVRTRAVFDQVPRIIASLIADAIARGPKMDDGGPARVIGEHRRRQWISRFVYVALLAGSVTLYFLAWQVSGGHSRELWPVSAILGAHCVVFFLGFTDQLRAGRRLSRIVEDSAWSPFWKALTLDADRCGQLHHRREVAAEQIHLLEIAIARVPDEVSTLGLRRQANAARLRLAEVFVEARNPVAAEQALDQMDKAGVTYTVMWRQYEGGGKVADMLDGWANRRLYLVRAHVATLTANPGAAMDAWLDALRVAPAQFLGFTSFLAAARDAGRTPEVVRALRAMSPDGPPPAWLTMVTTALLAKVAMPPAGRVQAGADPGHDVQVDPAAVQVVFQQHQEFLEGAGDPVGLVDDQGVAGVQPVEAGIEQRPAGAGAGGLHDDLAAVRLVQGVELELVVLLTVDTRA